MVNDDRDRRGEAVASELLSIVMLDLAVMSINRNHCAAASPLRLRPRLCEHNDAVYDNELGDGSDQPADLS